MAIPPAAGQKGIRRSLRAFLLLLLAALALPAGGCSRSEVAVPADKAIIDPANLLDATAKERLITICENVEEAYAIRLTTMILPKPARDIDQSAVRLFAALARPDQRRQGRELLFLIDPVGRQVRLEVGYELEGLFTDLFVARLETEQMLPFFEQGMVGAGIEATIELLVAQIEREGGEIDTATLRPGLLRHPSGGAGAKIAAGIGDKAGQPLEKEKAAASYSPQPSPRETLLVYLEVLRDRVKDPELAVYTEESRTFFRKWVVTDGQQANEHRALLAVIGKAESFADGAVAVVRFPPEERRSPPYFFRRGKAGWQLDITAMHELIRFNTRNQWHFTRLDHPYMFAFADWRFDQNGFPWPAE
ncbi:TPM domain-containing protein [Thiovibrio sp. JS02]